MTNANKTNKIETFTATVDWYKSKTWGLCPRLTGFNGFERITSTANGCGYDKLSTVLAHYLNNTPAILEKMQELKAWDRDTRPYGFRFTDKGYVVANGGVGVRSLIEGLNALGIDVIHTDGQASDHFTISGDFSARRSLTFVKYVWIHTEMPLECNVKTSSLDQFKRMPLRDEYRILEKFSRRVRGTM